jgi:hypothetical protein
MLDWTVSHFKSHLYKIRLSLENIENVKFVTIIDI